MGQGQSQHEQARSDELLQQLAGSQALEYQDIFWKHLFLSMSGPLAGLDPSLVAQKLNGICESLLLNNPSTHNLQVLVLHTVALLHDVKAGKNRRSAANAVRFISAVLGAINRSQAPRENLTSLFEISPTLPIPRELVAPGNHQLLKILVRRLMSTLAEVGPSEATYVVLFECACCLLVLASAQLAGNGTGSSGGAGPGRSPAIDALLTQQATAPMFMQRLLQAVMARPPPPRDGSLYLGRPAGQAGFSVVGMARSAAASLIWLPATTLSYMASAAGATEPAWPVPLSQSPLADVSLLLLLVLVHTPDHPPVLVNPFKWGLASLTDTSAGDDWGSGRAGSGAGRPSIDLEGGRGGSVSSGPTSPTTAPTIRYPALFDALTTLMHAPGPPEALEGGVAVGAEEGALLGYLLLHGCSSFRDYVLSRTDVELLLLPVLRHMYTTRAKDNPSLAYLLQVWVLILSQDALFAANVHRLLLPPGAASWYKEQLLTGGTGGSGGPGLSGASGPDAAAAAVAAGALSGPNVADRRGGGQGSGLTLGSLMVIVLLRTVSANFGSSQEGGSGASSSSSSGGGDLSLPTNALAALANLAPHTTYLHPHAAQRLLSLTQALAKRYTRLQAKVSAASQGLASGGPGAAQPDATSDAAAAGAELAVLEDYLRIVLEVINAALVGPHSHHVSSSGATTLLSAQATAAGVQLAKNSELVYALLHRQEVILGLRSNPRLSDLVNNLLQVIDFFNQRLDGARAAEAGGSKGGVPGGALAAPQPGASGASGQGGWSVERVLNLVSSSAHYWRPDKLRPFPELRFVYEEEGDAGAFFVPHVWGLVRAHAGWVLGAPTGAAAMQSR